LQNFNNRLVASKLVANSNIRGQILSGCVSHERQDCGDKENEVSWGEQKRTTIFALGAKILFLRKSV